MPSNIFKKQNAKYGWNSTTHYERWNGLRWYGVRPDLSNEQIGE